MLEAAVDQGFASQEHRLEPALLRRVQAGLLSSPLTPLKIKMAFAQTQHRGSS